jgi:hypothetical protein
MHVQTSLAIAAPIALSLIGDPAWAQQATFADRFAAVHITPDGCLTLQRAAANGLDGIAMHFSERAAWRRGCLTLPELVALAIARRAQLQQLTAGFGR